MNKLRALMKTAARPLQQAMKRPAPVEVTAPLHNSYMCLLLAVEAAKTIQLDSKAKNRHARD